MVKIKKILLSVGAFVLAVVAGLWLYTSVPDHIEDTNGADDYTLQTINDYNIIKMDVGARNIKESKSMISETVAYSSDKFTGVYEIYGENIWGNRFDITINHARVDSGNFKIVLVHNDEIVHEFKLNELTQSYTLEKPDGYVALRIAGESADFMFDYSLY